MDDYLSKTAQQQKNKRDSNKIEYLDRENLFEANFVTLHSLDSGIVAH